MKAPRFAIRHSHPRRKKRGGFSTVRDHWVLQEPGAAERKNSYRHPCPTCGTEIISVRMPNSGWAALVGVLYLHSQVIVPVLPNRVDCRRRGRVGLSPSGHGRAKPVFGDGKVRRRGEKCDCRALVGWLACPAARSTKEVVRVRQVCRQRDRRSPRPRGQRGKCCP